MITPKEDIHYTKQRVLQFFNIDEWIQNEKEDNYKDNYKEFTRIGPYYTGTFKRTIQQRCFEEPISRIEHTKSNTSSSSMPMILFLQYCNDLGINIKIHGMGYRALLYPTIEYPTRHMLSKDTIRPNFAKHYHRCGKGGYYESYDDDPYERCCIGCGEFPSEMSCRCPPRPNPYFADDNWRQREHDSEERFRLAD